MTGCPCGKTHQPTSPKFPFDQQINLYARGMAVEEDPSRLAGGRREWPAIVADNFDASRIVPSGWAVPGGWGWEVAGEAWPPLPAEQWRQWPNNSPMSELRREVGALEYRPGELIEAEVRRRHQGLVQRRSPGAYYRRPDGQRWTFGFLRQGTRFQIGQHAMVEAPAMPPCTLRAAVSIERHNDVDHQAVLLFTEGGAAQPWWAEFTNRPGLPGHAMRLTRGGGHVPAGLAVRGI